MATTVTKKPMKAAPPLPIADRTLTNLAQVFKLLADESRLKILMSLARDGEQHVSALCNLLGQSQPAVSHHLTLLRMAGLVGFRRDGKFNFYRLDGLVLGNLLEELFDDAGRASRIELGDFSVSFARTGAKRK